ncbi:hypothetical protein CHS0354_013676 [Potamilus streckersoni]|uniref:Uncharacterized protein n=1 Tax=Potamilus streckersoni TaxID=2493646 RepID=A0AAE0SFB9_9BIVA|nr:hypothetical protein CHS0354_013676 [Potamilus streckersoni]
MAASLENGYLGMQDEYPAAVWGKDVNKSYGRGKNKLSVLQGLNMNVPRGAIYGLLGPSGCGKTTLLRCIVGRLHFDSGHLIVLGDRPGAQGHGIPGSMVGYMPQETALFNEMTIGETLSYFGRIHGMNSESIKKRTNFLLEFLTLPKPNRLVKELSGGQKRRVSFSVALLHEPELLILDEPTVGVDPLLRERIWKHLLSISQSSGQKTTIIITTHYIEEARQANRVGLMRSGRLLAEEAPDTLLHQNHMDSLESVFLELCREDKNEDNTQDNVTVNKKNQGQDCSRDNDDEPLLDAGLNDTILYPNIIAPRNITDSSGVHGAGGCKCCVKCLHPRNILAQMIKNFTLMKRNIGFLLFEFMLPAIQIVLFCLCIGRDPYDLQFGVVNMDTQGFAGNLLLTNLDSQVIHQVPYSSLDAGLDSVKAGKTWGIIYINYNFTIAIIDRFAKCANASNTTLDESTVKLHLDMTNQQIALIIQEKVAQAFQDFSSNLLIQFHKNPAIAQVPIKLETPVYGSNMPSFTNFMAPGVIISITFFLATGLTTLSFVLEKKEGLLDRSLAAGMTSVEIMLAHVMTQLVVMAVQVAILLVCALLIFHVPYEGPLIWVIVLVLLQGFCGMALGMIFSSICDNESSAIQCALGSVYPMLLLSGIIWPVEAIPTWMRYISYSLPMTYAADALRCVLSRGWDITLMPVWRGFLTTMGWSLGLLLIAAIILRIKQ